MILRVFPHTGIMDRDDSTDLSFHPVLQIGSMNTGHFAFMGWLFDANLDDLQSDGD
jgi:hypothetical protein